ncbi:hypothetical protein HY641_00950 [Candidatus Woesearchaeota archaeon]|nr:hypothetical protein [Candidatus Woesearchaeota archaeon]
MRGEYALLGVVFLVCTAGAFAEEYEGTLDSNNPMVMFVIPVQNAQVASITPVIVPRSIAGEYHLRLEKEPGVVVREWNGSVTNLRHRTDSEKLTMEYSPVGLEGSFRLIVTSSDAATVRVAVDRTDAFDANTSGDADVDPAILTRIGLGNYSGHIAAAIERRVDGAPFDDVSAYVDHVDWYELTAAPEDKKLFVQLGPQTRGIYAIRVIDPEGIHIYNQSSIYPFEIIQFTLESNGTPSFFVEIGAPNASGGGHYVMSISEHDRNEPLEVIARARAVLISPLSTIPQEEGAWQRFWHVMIIAILGMMGVAMASAYHFGKRVPQMRTVKTTSEYIKQSLDAGYSSEQIEASLRAYGYPDALIRQGFEKQRGV